MTIGSRIRTRRQELGLTQDELAKKLGYESRSSINKIELDKRNLTQQRIADIAKALETTPSYIMGWTDHMEPDDAEFVQNLGNIHPLDELPADAAALNVFLYEIGERIIRTNGKYYLGECGEITEDELKRLKTAAVTSVKVAYDMLLAERRKELRRRLSGEF